MIENIQRELRSVKPLRLVAIALAVYIAWVAATYLLEGRVHLLQQVDPIGRMTYAAVANIAIGTVLTAIAIHYLLKADLLNLSNLDGTGRAPRLQQS